MKFSILSLAAVVSILHAAPKSATAPPPAFYTQSVDADGVTIRASSKVEKATIETVRARIVRVLANAPAIAANLKAAKVEMHIIARTEVITDLPEFQAFQKKYVEEGISFEHRYHGGKASGTLVACSEENVMRDATNPYPKDYDVCTHELAHIVLSIGIDAPARRKTIARYDAAMDEELYTDTYAGKSFDEFFAEGSARYFGYSGGGLGDSDPATFALLDSFYSGRYVPAASSVTDLVPLSGKAAVEARSTNGQLTSGIMFKNQSVTEIRESALGVDGQVVATTSRLVAGGSEVAVVFAPGTAVLISDEKTKGTIAIVTAQQDYGRISIDDKMVRAQKPPSAEQAARTSGPTPL